MPKGSASRAVVRVTDAGRALRTDQLAVEEPLEIRLGGASLSVTMRTPGDDFELVAGFLFSEGVVVRGDQIRTMRYCGSGEAGEYNTVDVELSGDAPGWPSEGVRRFGVTSACGVCGATSIEALRSRARARVEDDDVRVASDVLAALPERLRSEQATFERTGGLHAAALFDGAGLTVCVREDVGRHNAFDKVIGWALLHDRVPLRSHVMLASGRASFELVQKALVAGVPVLAAVSAPSSLAVELAADSGMTLVGFLRGQSMNVYCGGERVT